MKPSRKAPMVEPARARLTVDGHHKPLFLVLTVKIEEEEEEEQFFAFFLLLLFPPSETHANLQPKKFRASFTLLKVARAKRKRRRRLRAKKRTELGGFQSWQSDARKGDIAPIFSLAQKYPCKCTGYANISLYSQTTIPKNCF